MEYTKEYDNVFDELVQRGYYEQSTHEDEVKELLKTKKVPFYIGFDATADSLHVGHFIQIMVMMRMQAYGHIPVALLGGGTTMIGDPSGRSDMRQVMTKETIDHNADCFYKQFQRFIDFSDGKAIVENNADWLLDLNFVEFMREVGVHFSVNEMLRKDSYKNRLEQGLSFFEFSYMLLQSFDFLELYRRHDVLLQMGGSDQWSNIIGGVDLVRRKEQAQVYGMTYKLLTTADGIKMGKSRGGAVWLDKEKTSPYELFQYMRNVDDRDVEKFLLMLTFLPTDKCKELGSYKDQKINESKDVLAYEVTKIIHGKTEADKALETSHALFKGGKNTEDMPTTELEENQFNDGFGLLNLLTTTGLTSSNGEARRLVQQGGVSINDEKITDPKSMIDKSFFNKEGEIIIKKGKKTYHKVKLV